MPVGLNPSRRVEGSVRALKRCAGIGAALVELISSGSKVVLAPGRAAREAGGREIDLVERPRDDVLLIHVVVARPENADVADRRRLHAGSNFEAALQIADDLGRVIVDAPGLEQRLEIRRMVGHRAASGIRRVLAARVRARIGIDEQQYPAAAHHELVDGIQGFRRQLPSGAPASGRRRPCRCDRRRASGCVP